MSRPRIFRDELNRNVLESVILASAKISFSYGKHEEARSIYSYRADISEKIIERLLRDYSVVRKEKRERTV